MAQGAFSTSFFLPTCYSDLSANVPLVTSRKKLAALSSSHSCKFTLGLHYTELQDRTDFFFLASTVFVFTLAKYQYVMFMERLLSVCLHPAPAQVTTAYWTTIIAFIHYWIVICLSRAYLLQHIL